MKEEQHDVTPVPAPDTPGFEEPQKQAAARELPRSPIKRPWRWVLGAVSIAAVGAGVIFISKRGFRKPPEERSPQE